MSSRADVEELIYKSCMLLDEKNWKGFLDLCEPEFRYTVTAMSPEIRKDMTWLDHDKSGMQTLFNNLPRHNSDHSPITRHATVYSVKMDDKSGTADVITAFQVYRTELDGGATELFAVGKFHDTVKLNGKGATLLKRTVKLDTRQLGIGYHIPF